MWRACHFDVVLKYEQISPFKYFDDNASYFIYDASSYADYHTEAWEALDELFREYDDYKIHI